MCGGGGGGKDVNQLAEQDSVPNALTRNIVKDRWTQSYMYLVGTEHRPFWNGKQRNVNCLKNGYKFKNCHILM